MITLIYGEPMRCVTEKFELKYEPSKDYIKISTKKLSFTMEGTENKIKFLNKVFEYIKELDLLNEVEMIDPELKKTDDLFDIITETGSEIINGRKTNGIMYSIMEEVGELAKEIKVKYDPACYKKGDKDGILGEAADSIICLIDLLIQEGYTKKELLQTLKHKNRKWKSLAAKE